MKRKLFGLGNGAAVCVGVLVVFTVALVGCKNGADAFTAVTGITGVPTVAFMGKELPLSGTVAPADATNKTITWAGEDVGNGKLTAQYEKTYTITATVANGASESAAYTANFPIEVYDTSGGGGGNLFTGQYVAYDEDGEPLVVVTIEDTTWEAYVYVYYYEEEDHPLAGPDQNNLSMRQTGRAATFVGSTSDLYNKGTYTHDGKGAQWTVTEIGPSIGTGTSKVGDTGLAILLPDRKIRVANFYDANMNNTYAPYVAP